MKAGKKGKTVKKLPNKELTKLGNRIKALRIKMGYTNYEFFAYDHKISRAQYGRYENGEDLKYSSLVRIIKIFGMTQKEFFSEGFDE
ncbi:MAG TPA: helix-turn-helix transcriptional regulator [Bacteroidia bacterium]|nr:helix-turn-helix transcriptional regulator [Bacteroidia bacterium]